MTPGDPLSRRRFLAAASATAAFGVACGLPAAPGADSPAAGAPASAPGVPQVLLVDGRGAGGFAAYLEELLGAEGVLGVQRMMAPAAAPDVLDRVLAVVVDGPVLSPQWITALERFAWRGGIVVAITPGPAFLARCGIAALAPRGAPPDGVRVASPSGDVLRLHVEADTRGWEAAAGEADARFVLGDKTGAAAVVRRRHGAGMVCCWAFDVARNVALIRQGSPRRVDVERDGLAQLRFTDVMMGWADPDRRHDIDADGFVRLLVGQLAAAATGGPLLALDHFPGAARSVLIATGDAHGVGAGVIDEVLGRVEAGGGRLSVFYEPPQTPGWRRYARRARWAASTWPIVGGTLASREAPPSPRLVDEWRRRGHEFCPHPTSRPNLEAGLARAWEDFAADGYGTGHRVLRTHEVYWQGWVGTPRAQRRRGVRMNLDTYQIGEIMRQADGRWSHGHLAGSGLPARFVDEQGRVIDCYQQPTQIVDEQLLAVMGGPEGLTGAAAAAVVSAQMARAVADTPAALCAVFHVDSFVPAVGRGAEAGAFLDGVLRASRAHGAPVLTAGHWLAFLDARRGATITSRAWDAASGRLVCDLRIGPDAAPGLGVLLPAALDARRLRDVTLNGAPAAPRDVRRAGHDWVRVVAAPGPVRVSARYEPA